MELAFPTSILDDNGMELNRILESLLFATDRPLTLKAMALALQEAARLAPSPETAPYENITALEIEAAVEHLRAKMEANQSSLLIQAAAGGFQLKTRPEFAVWTNRLFTAPKSSRLSPPALETLAVIAYRQPISRAEIESVRGVAVDGVVANLNERKLIRIAGRAELPGRPLLYETTSLFLELFGLKNLDELPNADELRRILPPQPLSSDAPTPQQPNLVELDPSDEPAAEAGGPDRSKDSTPAPAAD